MDSFKTGKPNVGAVDYVKELSTTLHKNIQSRLYSALRNKKFTKWKDVHNDIDSLVSESVNEEIYCIVLTKKRSNGINCSIYKR